jgi:hypothetical protein
MHPGIQRGLTAPHPAAGVTRLGVARSRSSAVVDDGQRVAQRARAPSSRVGARATAVDERSDDKSLFLQLMHATEDYFVYMDTNRWQLSILCTCPNELMHMNGVRRPCKKPNMCIGTSPSTIADETDRRALSFQITHAATADVTTQ